ncbi:outer membrane protein assembly factor BamE [Herminiimonas sp. KBW02]|uniref:outer membrane protein assembly factor BamE n=1 Tax=Herminiimonas sp. KBW02 TaxID=2153363 RepID=UPI001F246AE5|nr:outer membrane protein assembly factor BamE [Herminiimonas sp. KBW02]
MQMLPRHSNRAPLLAGTFCLALAGVLSGCASKNPLIDEPAPVAAAAKPAAKPAAQPAPVAASEEKVAADAAKPAVAAAAPAASTTASGVQVKREKRFLGIFSPYRPDIQQGNFVSQEMVAQLKEGMTQDQVVFLLGTPLLTDLFHADRWDYAFRMQKGNGEITSSRVTVYFKDKLVSSYEGGGDLPTEKDYLARIADKAKAANK